MKYILLDNNNIFWRSALAVDKHLSFGAEYGSLKTLVSLQRTYPEHRLLCIWDSMCTWRKEIFPDYKHKDSRDVGIDRSDLYRRMDHFRTILSYIMPQYEGPGCEGDDVMAAMAYLLSSEGHEVVIFSNDVDVEQLTNDKVSVLRPQLKAPPALLSKDDICKKWGIIHPQQLMWLRAYTGCNSDKVPGSGVPKKKLAELAPLPSWEIGNPIERMLSEHAVMQKGAGKLLTKGWLKKFESFPCRAIRNYRIMSLTPARCCADILCNYAPDFDAFLDWLRRTDIVTLQGDIISYFGTIIEDDPFVRPVIHWPYATYKQLMDYENEKLGSLTEWKQEERDSK